MATLAPLVPHPLGLRDMNRLRVIESIYRHPGCSRADIARWTGLSRGTVSAVAEELDRVHLIREHDAPDEAVRPRGTGRPPTLLSLVPGAAFAIGIDIGHQHVRVTICGLAAPIDQRTGEVKANGILPGWHGVAPAAEIQDRLGISAQLANDADMGALGEKVFGAGRNVDDMIYIRLSAGVGAGLILAGQPYRGGYGMAGEIGHVCVQPSGQICRCGNRGCLETVASAVAVARLLEHVVERPMTPDQLFDLLAADDRGARRAVADAGEAVGMVVSWVVNVLNPELVVIGGDLAAAGDVLLDPIRASIQRHSVPGAAADVHVTAGVLGDRAEVLGAAALILAQSPLALAERVRS